MFPYWNQSITMEGDESKSPIKSMGIREIVTRKNGGKDESKIISC